MKKITKSHQDVKYYLDTEFHEYSKQPKILGFNVGKPINTIELISIGIVSKGGKEYYAICNEFDLKEAWNNEWLRKNVLEPIYVELVRKENELRKRINISYLSEDITYKNLKLVLNIHGKSRKQIAKEVIEFVGNKAMFYSYYADYDWVVFCWLWKELYPVTDNSTGMSYHNPNGFPYYCIDLKQELDRIVSTTSNKQLDAICQADLYHNLADIYTNDLSLAYKLSHLETHHPSYPKQTNEHNALADAKWNKELYDFIKTLNNDTRPIQTIPDRAK